MSGRKLKAYNWRRDLENLKTSREDSKAGRPSKYRDRLALLRRHKDRDREAWLLRELGESTEGSTEITGGPLADPTHMFTQGETDE